MTNLTFTFHVRCVRSNTNTYRCLSGILTMIMVRTLRRDIARYNADEGIEEALEESGWKLVHGDVFRPPRYPRLFAAVIGSGIQIFFMSLITICEYKEVFTEGPVKKIVQTLIFWLRKHLAELPKN